MLARLGIFATVLGTAIVLWLTGHCMIAIWLFVSSGLLVLEAAMFKLYAFSRFNLRIGKAEQAQLISGRDTYGRKVICIPISLKIDLWEVKDISVIVKSGETTADSVPYNRRGYSSLDDVFTLDWRVKRVFASLAFLDGKVVGIGNPVMPEHLENRRIYPITLEIWKEDKLIVSSCYNLSVSDGEMHLTDRIEEDKNATA